MIGKEELYSLNTKLESAKKLLQNSDIGDKNKELLDGFMSHNLGKGISIFRVVKYNNHLMNIARWASKDLDKCDRKT